MISKYILLAFGMFFLVTAHVGFAQHSLALDRSGHVKRVKFNVDDKIKVWYNDSVFSGTISYIGQNSIIIEEKEIPLTEIEAIKYRTPGFGAALLGQIAVKFPIAGGALLLFDVVNGAIDPKYSQFSPGIVITAGALIVSGPIAYFIAYRKYKIGERNQLKVVDVAVD